MISEPEKDFSHHVHDREWKLSYPYSVVVVDKVLYVCTVGYKAQKGVKVTTVP